MAYAQVSNSGKGFITHADQLILSFRGDADNIWEVVGATVDVDAWIARVGGTAKTSGEALTIVTTYTNFMYTRYEFFTEVVTPAQAAKLFEIAVGDVSFRPFVKQLLIADGMDMREQWMIDGVDLLLSKGHINQTIHDDILAGR